MKAWSPFVAMFVLTVPLSACTPSLPTPPDLSPVLQAYAMPTAVVDGEIMELVADEIAETAKQIEDSQIFDEILQVVIEVEQELQSSTTRTCNGGASNGTTCTEDAECPGGTCGDPALVLGAVCSGGANDGDDCVGGEDCPGGSCVGGVILPSPTGAVGIDYICPGWDEPDSIPGSLALTMTLDSGGIGRVAWGIADQCKYLVPNEGDDCEAAGCSQSSYDGGIALDLGPGVVSEDVEARPVTFVVDGNIGFNGGDFYMDQSFRIILAAESALEILVDISDPASPALTETFNYFFAADAQLVRDANGFFGCSLEDRVCFDLVCNAGANAGNACITDADCPEGTCDRRELFSW